VLADQNRSRDRVVGDPEVVEQVHLAQQGSAQAFARLYDHYVDQVYAFVYHRVGDRQTAEDLVGDVFLRALRRIATFKWQGVDFGAWLITIARNRVNDHFKSARFRLEAPVEEVFDSPAPDADTDPEHQAITGDLSRRVHEALRQLKGEQAEVLYLRFIQHLNVAETAAVMGKTEGAIKALQYRALRSLQKLLPEGLVES
jgi:RNA polymerase sigma-70 factor, ECF subfamily